MTFLSRVDPQLAGPLEMAAAFDVDLAGRTIEDIPSFRVRANEVLASLSAAAPLSDAVSLEDHMIPGPPGAPDIRVRLYRPIGQEDLCGCLYWIHGGGMVMGNIEMDDQTSGGVSPYAAPARADDVSNLRHR